MVEKALTVETMRRALSKEIQRYQKLYDLVRVQRDRLRDDYDLLAKDNAHLRAELRRLPGWIKKIYKIEI